ncbi:MAG: hypothetical protein FJW61_06745 [Actinobacteria bacterium]|nr:hypothetical protein [Actinomycetota bacterium]
MIDKIKAIEKSIIIGVIILVFGFFVLLIPFHTIFADPGKCSDRDTSGDVTLKSVHIGQNWDTFSHEDCEELELQDGQVLWHLVLSPVGDEASASISGIPGTKHGSSIAWTFINNSTTADSWVASVTDGLVYSGPDCDLRTELRVSHTCKGGSDTTDPTETTATETTATETTATETTATETTATETTATETTATETTVTITTSTVDGENIIVVQDNAQGIIEILGISELPYTGFNFIYLIIGVISVLTGLIILLTKKII